MEVKCDIIVLTWNQKSLIKDFVKSLLKNTFTPSRLIIIDNASKDGTQEYLRSVKGNGNVKIEVVFNKENLGYVGGMNQGLEMSKAEYVCLMNNDVLMTKGWLSKMIRIAESYPQIGIVNPQSNNFGVFPPKNMDIDRFAQTLEKYGTDFVEFNTCIGFCMLIKREVIEKIGFLSTEFAPIFFEDTDFSMRAKEAGYLCVGALAAYVWHHEHKAVSKMKEKEEIFRRNRKKFEKKWGRFLRIAFISDETPQTNNFKEDFLKVLKMARFSNFVHFFFRNPQNISSQNLFRNLNENVNCNISFFYPKKFFNYTMYVLWRILKRRKKKYDIIVAPTRYMLNNFKHIRFFHKADVILNERMEFLLEFCRRKKFKNENSSNLQ